MANTFRFNFRWSGIGVALRTFAFAVAASMARLARGLVSAVVGWVRTAAGKPHLSLAERWPRAGLNARATFHLRAAKRSRPTVRARWRMCASV